MTEQAARIFRRFCDALEWNDGGIELIRLTEEIYIVSEIKDIRDELKIIRTVFEQQDIVLRNLHAIMFPITLTRVESMVPM
jgi:hypothetical protein